MGGSDVRELDARFDLSGRVDLYHAFVKAMTVALRGGGILGLLTSNRFLTVQSGSSTRDWLLKNFQLLRLIDLGDTKLFEAAVLPAIVIARRRMPKRVETNEQAENLLTAALSPSGEAREKSVPPANGQSQECEYIRVYASRTLPDTGARPADSVLEVLDGSFSGHARVNGVGFEGGEGTLLARADRG